MNIVQCQFCKKPFAAISGRICPACMQQIDVDFITIRDYIDEHPHARIDEISEETEIKKQIIIHLIKEGRLILDNEGGDASIVCEACKKPIRTGRLCEACMSKINSSIDKKAPAPAASKPAEQNFKGSAKIR